MTGIAKAEAIRLAMGLGVLGVTVTGLTTVATGAFFTDTESGGTYGFVMGTVKLGVTPVQTALGLGDMAPGSATAGVLSVKNTGSLEERYTATVKTTEDQLASHLRLTVTQGAATCKPEGAVGGSQLYNGPLGSTAGTQVLKDITIAPGTTHSLCAVVSFPTTGTNDGDNKYQGLKTAATVTFDSVQTLNNP
ncbi:MAG: hypothetical protein ACXVYY_10185 [Oryzihumus sp.]